MNPNTPLSDDETDTSAGDCITRPLFESSGVLISAVYVRPTPVTRRESQVLDGVRSVKVVIEKDVNNCFHFKIFLTGDCILVSNFRFLPISQNFTEASSLT